MRDCRGSRCIRSRALASFVGKQSALNTLHHGRTETGARDFLNAQCVTDNISNHSRHLVKVRDDYKTADKQVGHRHKRHDDLGDIGNAVNTAKDDEACNHGDTNTDDGAEHGVIAVKREGHRIRDGVGLEGVVDQTKGKGNSDGEKNAKRAPAQTPLHVVRWAATVTITIAHLPQLRQRGFDECSCTTKDGDEPHPKDSTWTAHGNGHGHAGYVTGADAGGGRDSEGLESRDAAVVLILIATFPLGPLDDGAEHVRHHAHLHQSGTDAEE